MKIYEKGRFWLCRISLLMLSLQPAVAVATVSALVAVTHVHQMEMTKDIRCYGAVEFSPEGGQSLSLETEASVTQVLVAVGQRVSVGEPLVRVAPSVNDKMLLRQARIADRFALQNLRRARSLRARELATNVDVESAAQILARSNSSLQELKARLRPLVSGVIRSPMDGVVQSVGVHQGDFVTAGQPLLGLAKDGRLRVLLGIEPADLARVKVGDSVVLRPISGGWGPYISKVDKIYWQLDPQTMLAQVMVRLPALPDMLAGSMVRGEIQTGKAQVLAVPESAILRESGKSYCYATQESKRREDDNGCQ